MHHPTPPDEPADPSAPVGDPHAPYVIVRGRGGLLGGEFVKVPLGDVVTVGRSRRCRFSLKKSARYLLSSGADRAEIRGRLSYRAVSRHHCSIAFTAPGLVEVVNHSPNGTFVDGRAVAHARLHDVATRSHAIRLGPHGDELDVEAGSLAPLPEESVSR